MTLACATQMFITGSSYRTELFGDILVHSLWQFEESIKGQKEKNM